MPVKPTPIPFPRPIPFAQHLGFELVLFEGGQAHIQLDPGPHHENSFDVVHGGALMTLLDVTMAHAIRSAESDDVGCATIEMKTSFMRGAVGPITAQGRILHRTKSMAFAEATVVDASGQACCHATGTFKVFARRPSEASVPSVTSVG
jgi:uncharacterized protein (TIGR00369 family)